MPDELRTSGPFAVFSNDNHQEVYIVVLHAPPLARSFNKVKLKVTLISLKLQLLATLSLLSSPFLFPFVLGLITICGGPLAFLQLLLLN